MINHLPGQLQIREDRLKLREFVQAAALCRSIDLMILHDEDEPLDLVELVPLAGSLVCLSCKCYSADNYGILRGINALSSLQQLTSLRLVNEDLSHEEPWDHLVKLTSLEQLSLDGHAGGDPSPLSALTRLSSLDLFSIGLDDPFTFSSLQPLSTLQQ
jgi:hypothetical protein